MRRLTRPFPQSIWKLPSWEFPTIPIESSLKLADAYIPLFGATMVHYFIYIGDVQKLKRYFRLHQGAITEDINQQSGIQIGLNKRQDLCVQAIIK